MSIIEILKTSEDALVMVWDFQAKKVDVKKKTESQKGESEESKKKDKEKEVKSKK